MMTLLKLRRLLCLAVLLLGVTGCANTGGGAANSSVGPDKVVYHLK